MRSHFRSRRALTCEITGWTLNVAAMGLAVFAMPASVLTERLIPMPASISLLFVLALTLSAAAIGLILHADRLRTRFSSNCARCGYDRRIAGPVCPECGF